MRRPAMGRVRRSLLRSDVFVSGVRVTGGTGLLGAASSRGPCRAIPARTGAQTRSEAPDYGGKNMLPKKSIFYKFLRSPAKLSPTRGSKIRRFGMTTPATTTPCLTPGSPAFRMSAAGAGHAAFDHPHVISAAGRAAWSARRVEIHHRLRRVRLQPKPLAFQEPDRDHVLLEDSPDRRKDRWDVLALHPRAAARIEHRFQLLDHETHIAAAPEHRRDHPRQRHGPGEMLHVLRVDEHLEGPPVPVQHDIVHRDIDRMVAVGPFQLVGRPLKLRGPVQRL